MIRQTEQTSTRQMFLAFRTLFLMLLLICLPWVCGAQNSETELPEFVPAPHETVEDTDNADTGEYSLPLKELRLFALIFDHIRRSYVEPVSDRELLENAIKGMLQELDPHSDYLDATHFSALQDSTKGEFSGVGLEIGQENGYIKVITPIDESPAARAGIQAGDLIIKLDNQAIRGLSLSEVAKRMRGVRGTSVLLTVIRQGRDQPIDIPIVRDTIKTQSVRSRLIERDFGYVRISQFQANTGKDFISAVTKLNNENQLKGLVLDLRNNPGGILQASVEIADALIDKGLIVYTEGRLNNSRQSFSARVGDITKGLPVVVLINSGSASAAEIVAGALQDHNRAVIMGTPSFGKGSVQTVLPVGQDKGIKLTTARYFTPEGRSIQAQGIIPDVVVKRAIITELSDNIGIKEANLSGHISNTNEDKPREVDTSERQRQTEDNQLYEALSMLKGLAIFQRGVEKQQKLDPLQEIR